MPYKIVLHFAFLLMSFQLKAQTTSVHNWTKYCGWHYANGTPPNWAGWAREYAKDKFGLFISDTITYQIDTVALQNSYNILATMDTSIDLLQLAGGLASARDTTKVIHFMDMIEADNGVKWKNIVYDQSKKLTQLSDAENRIFWQIGNEITSPAYSSTIRYWQGQPYFNGYNFDDFIIPYYVENYLAPTVEAIDAASLDVYGQTGRIKICLGSLTNAHNPMAQIFLDSLLNYQIVGTNAPSLTGLKVSDLIHLITIHYAMGTANTTDWLSNITAYKNWTGTGRIQGVWSTEEVGINQATAGNGAFVGSIVTTRYLEWAINNQYTSKEARTNYFGWNTGNPITTVNTFNTFLYTHLGDTKLSNIDPLSTSINATNTTEKHSFKTELGDKGALFVFPERIQGQNTTATINEITLNHLDWGNIQSITVYRNNNAGINGIASTITQVGNTTTLSFSSTLLLENTDGLLVLINMQTPLSVNGFISTSSNFSIYPNPTTGYLAIKTSDNQNYKEQIQIFNIIGSLVKEIELPQSKQINVSELTNGVYFICFKHSPQQTMKFIKQ
jgi:hypothetical protein